MTKKNQVILIFQIFIKRSIGYLQIKSMTLWATYVIILTRVYLNSINQRFANLDLQTVKNSAVTTICTNLSNERIY